jgi:hypothetical protein
MIAHKDIRIDRGLDKGRSVPFTRHVAERGPRNGMPRGRHGIMILEGKQKEIVESAYPVLSACVIFAVWHVSLCPATRLSVAT